MLTVPEATNAFIQGWIRLRQRGETTVAQHGALTYVYFDEHAWVSERKCEIFAVEQPPESVLQLIRSHTPDRYYWVSVVTTHGEQDAPAYQSGGYTLLHHEYLMARELSPKSFQKDVLVHQINTETERQWFNASYNLDIVSPALLADRQFGCYYIRADDQPVSRGCSIIVGDTVIAEGIETRVEYQRRSFGLKIMNTLLAEAAKHGAKQAALVATEEGYKLYQKLGYEDLADVLVFAPA